MITKESTSSKHSKINNDFSSAFTGFHKMSTTSSPTIIFLRLSGIQHMLPNNFPFLCNSTITLEYISQPSLQLSDFSCTNTILHSSQVNHQLFQPKYPVPLEATSKGLPRGYSRSVCVCVCVRLHSENFEPTTWFGEMTPDEHPPTPPPCRWPAPITLRTPTKFQLVWCRLCDVVLFRSSCLFERTLAAVCASRGSDW